MAKDVSLYFHGTSASGATLTASTFDTTLPVIDLGSNSVNRALLVRMYVGQSCLAATGIMDVRFSDSTDNVTFSVMSAAGTGAIGMRTSTHSYSSTDAVAADAPKRCLIRTDKRYIRAEVMISTSGSGYGKVTIVGDVVDGGFAFANGPRDT